MKTKLIKLNENHYIIVDDSEIKEGDWYWTPIKRSIEQCVKKLLIIKGGQNDVEQFKITHSTQPLEYKYGSQKQGFNMGAMSGDVELVFDKIKEIKLSEVQELIYGYSVEKMADSYRRQIDGEEKLSVLFIEKLAYIEGFKAHQKLVKDKLFTVEDMRRAIVQARVRIDGVSPKYTRDEIIQSLLPKEWDIEFNEQGKIKLL
jgi:hypothetical protein